MENEKASTENCRNGLHVTSGKTNKLVAKSFGKEDKEEEEEKK